MIYDLRLMIEPAASGGKSGSIGAICGWTDGVFSVVSVPPW